jgi:uncharacterized protein (TIGR02996 family)
MNDSEFLASIIARPDDDATRVVHADWLEEHGQPERADLIRTQCALARMRYDDDNASTLRAREWRLLARHYPKWREELGGGPGSLRRGFVEKWSPHPHSFLEHAAEQFALHPIRDLTLGCQDVEGWGPEVAANPYLSRIETLRLPRLRSCQTDLADFSDVLASPHLTKLTTLDAGGGHGYGDAGLRELLGVSRRKKGNKGGFLPSLRKLRRLSLSGMELTDNGLRQLVRSPLTETLVGLDLSPWSGSRNFTEAGISALVESPLWPRLEELNLNWNAFGNAEPLRLLFGSLHRSSIRRLGCRQNWSYQSRWDGLEQALTTAPSWGRLEALDLGSTALSPEGLRHLLEGDHFANLRWLALDHIFWDDAVRDLALCPRAANLTALWLEDGGVTDLGMRYLAESPFLTRLVYLNVAGTRVRDKGLAEFVRSPNAAHLRFLELPGNLGDEALQAIADSPYTTRLNVITFGSYLSDGYMAKLTDAGLLALTQSPNLPNLACVNLHEMKDVTDNGWDALLESDRFASVSGGDLIRRPGFRERFPLQSYDLAGFKLLRLFPWAEHTYP